MIEVVIFTPYTFSKSGTVEKPPGINPKDGTIVDNGYSISRKDVFDTTENFRWLVYARIDSAQWKEIEWSNLMDAWITIKKLSRENGGSVVAWVMQKIEQQVWKVFAWIMQLSSSKDYGKNPII